MKKNEKVATSNVEIKTIAWYEENLAKAKKEWHEIAQSYGVEDHQLVDLGFGDWVILNQNAECQETVCEADDDYETITDKQECRRLTYLNNVIDSWSEKIRKMKKLKKYEIDELRKETKKNFLWRMWDFAKYHKEVVEEKTNPSETAYMVLNCAISDAIRLVLLANGLNNPSGLPLSKENNDGDVFAHLLATGEVKLNDAEKNMLTSFDVVQWYNLGVDELKNKYGWGKIL